MRGDAPRAAPRRFPTGGDSRGVLELDESLPDCVVREVREETGLESCPCG
jgi:hypothetical protein